MTDVSPAQIGANQDPEGVVTDDDLMGLTDTTIRDIAANYFNHGPNGQVNAPSPVAPPAPAGPAPDVTAVTPDVGVGEPGRDPLDALSPADREQINRPLPPPAVADDYVPPGGPLPDPDEADALLGALLDPPAGSVPDPAATTPPATAPAATEGYITLPNGQRYSLDRLQSLVDLDHRALNAPSAIPAPAPAAPAPPALPAFSQEDLDDMDPAMRQFIAASAQQQSELAQLRATVNQTQQYVIDQRQENVARMVTSTASQFQNRYGLDDELMTKVNVAAANSRNVELYASGHDPITGARTDGNPVRAVERALEIAYWAIPEGRARELRLARDKDVRARDRKQRNAALAGSSGSAPRQVQRELNTPEAMREAAVEEIAAAWFGGETNA